MNKGILYKKLSHLVLEVDRLYDLEFPKTNVDFIDARLVQVRVDPPLLNPKQPIDPMWEIKLTFYVHEKDICRE